MKKVIYLTFLLLLTITANAQENDDSLIFYDKLSAANTELQVQELQKLYQ